MKKFLDCFGPSIIITSLYAFVIALAVFYKAEANPTIPMGFIFAIPIFFYWFFGYDLWKRPESYERWKKAKLKND